MKLISSMMTPINSSVKTWPVGFDTFLDAHLTPRGRGLYQVPPQPAQTSICGQIISSSSRSSSHLSAVCYAAPHTASAGALSILTGTTTGADVATLSSGVLTHRSKTHGVRQIRSALTTAASASLIGLSKPSEKRPTDRRRVAGSRSFHRLCPGLLRHLLLLLGSAPCNQLSR